MQSSAHAEPFWLELDVMDVGARERVPNGVCVVDGKLHVGMNEGKFIRVNLCCTQQKLEGVLSREDARFAFRRVELTGGTHKWMEIDRKLRWRAQSQAVIGILRRNTGGCRGEGESNPCMIIIWSNLQERIM